MKKRQRWLLPAIIGAVGLLVMLVVGILSLFLPLPVPEQQVFGLVTCITSDTCTVPRARIRVHGVEYWSVSIVDRDFELRYIADADSLKIMLTMDGQPMLLEDTKSSGVVDRFVEIGLDGKAQASRVGDQRFEELFLQLQDLYYRSMSLANKAIIPWRSSKRFTQV